MVHVESSNGYDGVGDIAAICTHASSIVEDETTVASTWMH
jgi:hypothetical protein